MPRPGEPDAGVRPKVALCAGCFVSTTGRTLGAQRNVAAPMLRRRCRAHAGSRGRTQGFRLRRRRPCHGWRVRAQGFERRGNRARRVRQHGAVSAAVVVSLHVAVCVRQGMLVAVGAAMARRPCERVEAAMGLAPQGREDALRRRCRDRAIRIRPFETLGSTLRRRVRAGDAAVRTRVRVRRSLGHQLQGQRSLQWNDEDEDPQHAPPEQSCRGMHQSAVSQVRLGVCRHGLYPRVPVGTRPS